MSPGILRDSVIRVFLVLGLAVNLTSEVVCAWAQQPAKIPVVGVLLVPPPYFAAFDESLRKLGYTPGRNIVFETSSIEREYFPNHLTTDEEAKHVAKIPEAAADLVRMNVDVIVTGPNSFIDAARRATKTIPIVMAYGSDPVGQGYISSLARPGGNITGLAWEPTPEIFGKFVELLTEVMPRPSTIAGIVDPTYSYQAYWKEAVGAAKRRGAMLRYVEARSDSDVSKAFSTIVKMRASGVVIFGGPNLWILRNRIADFALKNRLPTVYPYREGPEAGGLMSYGPNLTASWRRMAIYVDKVLKGAKPGELPVEQPTQFELIVNLKTAKTLGITIPESILLRADEVIR
ncbi:MAG TPA: ABC transporter substrate-binding protein [Candidatus Acidoferrum sp.]|nr:ABC transporter substrate-binding protein [Candidatus Acidoferrum sp.]